MFAIYATHEHQIIIVLNGGKRAEQITCMDPEGGTGAPDPPEPKKPDFRFLSNTGPDPLYNHKATKPELNVGPSSTCQ